MFEKIKQLSEILLIPVAVLYIFGFLCINAYFARFGIISFEALNSRFIIAGIYPLICLAVVLFLAWRLYSRLPPNRFFERKSWKERYVTHLDFITFLLGSAFVIGLVLRIGEYRAPSEQGKLLFKPVLGSLDFVGEKIAQLPLDISVSANLIIKATLYLFSYSLLIILSGLLLFIIYRWTTSFYLWLVSKGYIVRQGKTEIQKAEIPLPTNQEVTVPEPTFNAASTFSILVGDVFILCFYFALFLCSFNKLRVELFDFQSFLHNGSVSMGLIFAWLLTSTFLVYGFLMSTERPAEQLKLEFTEHLTDYGKLQWAIQQLVVPILGALVLFGATIFPRIPFMMGGGEPRPVRIFLQEKSYSIASTTAFLIGENNQFFFLVLTGTSTEVKGKALQINKSAVVYLETRDESNK